MCGKFSAMYSWKEVHDFSQVLSVSSREGANDEVVTYRVAGELPVITFDKNTKQRRVVPMQWGFPHHANPRRPQPIHARSETIETTAAFRDAFVDGQRGIVVMRTFNEGEEVGSKTAQWTIDPGDGVPRGFAFLWRRFELEGLPGPLLACVMVTVPASQLIRPITDRMPAILEDSSWATWLNEVPASPDEAKAVLKTMEGVNWQMTKEPKPTRQSKPKPQKPEPQPELF